MGKTRLGGLNGGLFSALDQGRLGRVTRLAMKPYTAAGGRTHGL